MITDLNTGSPPILPLLYTTFLSRFGITYHSSSIRDHKTFTSLDTLIPEEISNNTIRSYVHTLSRFLNYLEACRKSHDTPGMHASSACSEKFVNHYLNNVLAATIASSQTLEVHRSALASYFNWLDYMKLAERLDLKINRTTRQRLAEKHVVPRYIQYVSKSNRTKLLFACDGLGEKLIMRMGFEVGLRTSEVAALRIDGKGKLKELFSALVNEEHNHIQQFRYLLEGRYTKRGKSRWIYFGRELLLDMKRYFDTERKWIAKRNTVSTDCFFLRKDNRFFGSGIGSEQASRVFKKRAIEAGLNVNLSYHDLRHTFATELFHQELQRSNGRETRSESAALIVVAQRLGHSFKDGYAPSTTTRYIRMRLQLMECEGVSDLL